MRKGIGAVCIVLGTAFLIFALCLVGYNQYEAKSAESDAEHLLEAVRLATPSSDAAEPEENAPEEENPSADMATIPVNGYECIGVLTIPALDLELPVLAEWSYGKLKKAPCHYYGSYNGKNFVIAAHNYKSHFGKLSLLQAGDAVIFTDALGKAHLYEVVLTETLPPKATEEMITSGFDLSLYTCTTGGGSRVTVRCNIKK